MDAVVYHFVSGEAFFSGAALLTLSAALAVLVQRRWARIAARLAAVVGLLFAAISARRPAILGPPSAAPQEQNRQARPRRVDQQWCGRKHLAVRACTPYNTRPIREDRSWWSSSGVGDRGKVPWELE
jgi:hypothetical protein